jgi:hypothetical protein
VASAQRTKKKPTPMNSFLPSSRGGAMTSHAGDRLTPLLRDPTIVRGWGEGDWDLLVRQGRRAGLLPRAQALIEEAGLTEAVPAAPQRHLRAAAMVATSHACDVRREVARIVEALAGVDAPVVLLKGAAYALASLPAARGRLFGDIDVMVPRMTLPAVEAALIAHGWEATVDDAYDQAYYRRWMHELPPLRHRTRLTTIDVHHTIVPPTAGLAVDPAQLLAAAVPLDVNKRLYRLGAVDLVLHAAVHLFNDGEFGTGLRDLDDLDRLLRYFAAEEPGFENALTARALQFRLGRPLFFALRYAAEILGTPVSAAVMDRLAPAAPGPFRAWAMDALFRRALRPQHTSCAAPLSGLAAWLLYVRGHYLRMPVRLLLPHLARKSFGRRLAGAA